MGEATTATGDPPAVPDDAQFGPPPRLPPDRRRRPGDRIADAPAEPPVVTVSIGRVEVVAAQPPATPRPKPRLSLDDYLAGRR